MTESPPSALITGASRGIGYGIARSLAAKGWSLTIAARDKELLETRRAELESLGSDVRIFAGDLSNDETLEELVDQHRTTYGRMNALILAAGVGYFGPIEGYPLRRFDRQVSINVRAPYALVARSLPMLRAAAEADYEAGARVVALASMEGVYPEAGLSAYGASKAALLSLISSINIEEGSNGITASAISPGYVDTEMSQWIADTIPSETMIPVDDVVKVVELILSISRRALVPHVIMNRVGASPYQA